MTNLEKWKYTILAAKDGHELVKILDEMDRALSDKCKCSDCVEYDVDCKECTARQLDKDI